MRAGQADTHGKNDLLVLRDTFNKFYFASPGIPLWNRGTLACPDNKTNNTHTDMITRTTLGGKDSAMP